MQSDSDLTQFRARTPDQKVRATVFDGPNSPPLRPNQTRIEDVESLLPPHDPPEYFLKRIPKTSSFELSGAHFAIGGATPRVRSRHELPTVLANGDKSTNTVLADLRAATSNCRNGGS
jgi:hypothetical protein